MLTGERRPADRAAVRLQQQPARRPCRARRRCAAASRARTSSPSCSSRCGPTPVAGPTCYCPRPRSSSTTISPSATARCASTACDRSSRRWARRDRTRPCSASWSAVSDSRSPAIRSSPPSSRRRSSASTPGALEAIARDGAALPAFGSRPVQFVDVFPRDAGSQGRSLPRGAGRAGAGRALRLPARSRDRGLPARADLARDRADRELVARPALSRPGAARDASRRRRAARPRARRRGAGVERAGRGALPARDRRRACAPAWSCCPRGCGRTTRSTARPPTRSRPTR